jgi:hypothetical protein
MTPSRDPHKARELGGDHALMKPEVEIPEVRSMIGAGGVPSDAFAEGKHQEVPSSLSVWTPRSSPSEVRLHA